MDAVIVVLYRNDIIFLSLLLYHPNDWIWFHLIYRLTLYHKRIVNIFSRERVLSFRKYWFLTAFLVTFNKITQFLIYQALKNQFFYSFWKKKNKDKNQTNQSYCTRFNFDHSSCILILILILYVFAFISNQSVALCYWLWKSLKRMLLKSISCICLYTLRCCCCCCCNVRVNYLIID